MNNQLSKKSLKRENQHFFKTKLELQVESLFSPFQKFVQSQVVASVLLLFAFLLALLFSSLELLQSTYEQLMHLYVSIGIGGIDLEGNLKEFTNDFLMTLFFFILGLEIKKGLLVGELSNLKTSFTVLMAALGGVVAPALIFYVLAPAEYKAQGWGIPVATDTAFAVGMLMLLKNQVPKNLFVFLAALAVIDDLVAILIMAFFYSSSLQLEYLIICGGITFVLVLINMMGFRNYLFYLIIGSVLWFYISKAGFHGTLAGVIVALTVPARPKKGPRYFITRVNELVLTLREKEKERPFILLEDDRKLDIIAKIKAIAEDTSIPLTSWYISLVPLVYMLILPLFALLNAGIDLSVIKFDDFFHPLAIAIALALAVGKPIGVFAMLWIVLKLKIGRLPESTYLKHYLGLGMFAGIGFTMSLFIAELAFSAEHTAAIYAKTGIFSGSLLAAILGFLYLRWISFQNKKAINTV